MLAQLVDTAGVAADRSTIDVGLAGRELAVIAGTADALAGAGVAQPAHATLRRKRLEKVGDDAGLTLGAFRLAKSAAIDVGLGADGLFAVKTGVVLAHAAQAQVELAIAIVAAAIAVLTLVGQAIAAAVDTGFANVQLTVFARFWPAFAVCARVGSAIKAEIALLTLDALVRAGQAAVDIAFVAAQCAVVTGGHGAVPQLVALVVATVGITELTRAIAVLLHLAFNGHLPGHGPPQSTSPSPGSSLPLLQKPMHTPLMMLPWPLISWT